MGDHGTLHEGWLSVTTLSIPHGSRAEICRKMVPEALQPIAHELGMLNQVVWFPTPTQMHSTTFFINEAAATAARHKMPKMMQILGLDHLAGNQTTQTLGAAH